MEPAHIELLGGVAATLTTGCFALQAWHIYKYKETAGVSLPMYIVLLVGIVLWLAYGVLIMSWPIIISNIVTFWLATTIIALKKRYG
jgi:MtN3 and saliva related transmembrane protein